MCKKYIYKIFIFYIVIFSFVSCTLAFDNADVLYSDYEIDGMVVNSKSGEPIDDVSLVLLEAVQIDDNIVPGHKMDSLKVESDGTFAFYGRSYGGFSDYKFIKLIRLSDDVDNPDSGEDDESENEEIEPEELGLEDVEQEYSEIFRVELSLISYPHEIAVTSQGCYGVSDLVLEIDVNE